VVAAALAGRGEQPAVGYVQAAVTDEFAPVRAAVDVMSGFPHPWWIAGGWAIDLFAGRVTREHGDVEIGVFRDTQGALHDRLRQFELTQSSEDGIVPWTGREPVAPSVFQLLARHESLPGGELQVFLDDRTGGRWSWRRDRRISRDERDVASPSILPGVHVLAPEIQLLYKAKYDSPKQEHDFGVALPLMSPVRRQWLRESLALTSPTHRWIARL
jgi:hypothetical protein